MQYVLATAAAAFVIYIAWSSHIQRNQVVYFPAPTIGSVVGPVQQQIGPITNLSNSPWIQGVSGPDWNYNLGME